MMKVKDRSEKTVITTGMLMSPCAALRELKSLHQECTMSWAVAGDPARRSSGISSENVRRMVDGG